MAINKKYAKRLFSFAILAVLSLSEIAFVQPALADESLFNNQEGMSNIGQAFDNRTTDVRSIVANLIQVVLGLLATVFLAMTITAGIKYMTSNGNEDQTKKAVAQIKNATIGLMIVMASWAITLFVLRLTSRSINNSVTLY